MTQTKWEERQRVGVEPIEPILTQFGADAPMVVPHYRHPLLPGERSLR